MTIENERAFLNGIWDWSILDGCFGETRIKPTDIDGLVERNGHFLILECKAPGTPVKQGQSIMLTRAVSTGYFTAMIVWGEQSRPEKLQIIGCMGDLLIDPCDLDTFRHYVRVWFSKADQQKPGAITTPLLTRKVIEMFNDINMNIVANNSLLLQIIDKNTIINSIDLR